MTESIAEKIMGEWKRMGFLPDDESYEINDIMHRNLDPLEAEVKELKYALEIRKKRFDEMVAKIAKLLETNRLATEQLGELMVEKHAIEMEISTLREVLKNGLQYDSKFHITQCVLSRFRA